VGVRLASIAVVVGSVLALAAPASTTNRPPSLLLFNAPYEVETAFGVVRSDGKGRHVLSHEYTAQSWSPNGRRILAYGGPTSLAILDARSRLVRALPVGGRFLNEAAWSPDGRWVAGLSESCPHPEICADLRILRTDGSEERTLVAGSVLPPGFDFDFDWAPSSRSIAYNGSASSAQGGTPGYRGIVIVSLAGRTLTPEALRNASGPSWAPNGKRLAFSRDGQIYTAGADGSGLKQLTRGAIHSFSPSWSPDGGRIAYVHGSRVEVLDLRRHRVTRPYRAGRAFVWSPDGTRLAFGGEYRGMTYVFVARADGRGKRRPITEGVIADWR
jgi:Tol biopolymer transport system component